MDARQRGAVLFVQIFVVFVGNLLQLLIQHLDIVFFGELKLFFTDRHASICLVVGGGDVRNIDLAVIQPKAGSLCRNVDNAGQVDGIHPHLLASSPLLVKIDDALVCEQYHVTHKTEASLNRFTFHQVCAVFFCQILYRHLTHITEHTGSQRAAQLTN